ncbi:MAG: hypothetical protein J6C87_06270 [Bacteroides sp.]|nr:hypothetical protein [Bacteroides sp.]
MLGTCAEIENIKFRLDSGRAKFIADGGKLGRKVGYRKSKEKKQEEYKEVIKELKRATSIRRTVNYAMSLSLQFKE